MGQIAELVINQIDDALIYLPAGCIWAVCITMLVFALGLVWKVYLHKSISRIFFWRLLPLLFFIAYVYCVLQLTVFSRKVGNFGGIDWRFLVRWNENDAQKAFLISNIIMFIPFGIFLPMLGKWMRHILISLPIAVACSISIEAVQLRYQLGFCQLDDVVANSTGFLVGFLIYLIIYDVYLFLLGIWHIFYKIITSK